MKKLFFLILMLFITSSSFAADNDSLTILELKTQIKELQEKQKGINWNTVLPISLVIAIIGGLLYNLTKMNIKTTEERMLKQFEARLEEQIIKTINDKKELISKTLEHTDVEQRLLQNKRIYRIGEADDALIKKVLKNVDFNLQNYYVTDEEAKNGFDVLLINNANGQFQDLTEFVNQVNQLSDNVVAFYYNTTQKFFPSKDLNKGKEDKVNFATNPAQIYGNLLNTLKYQDKLQQQKQ